MTKSNKNTLIEKFMIQEEHMALRKKIVKLAKMVGGPSGMIFKIDENAPEYYSLECVVSDEQADVALAMGLRTERTAEEIARRCGKPVEETRKLALELSQIGVCKVSNHDGNDKIDMKLTTALEPLLQKIYDRRKRIRKI